MYVYMYMYLANFVFNLEGGGGPCAELHVGMLWSV